MNVNQERNREFHRRMQKHANPRTERLNGRKVKRPKLEFAPSYGESQTRTCGKQGEKNNK